MVVELYDYASVGEASEAYMYSSHHVCVCVCVCVCACVWLCSTDLSTSAKN